MLEDYKFLSDSFEEKKIVPLIIAVVNFKNEENDLLRSNIKDWYSQDARIMEVPEDLFGLLNQKSQKVLIILNEDLIDHEFFRAIRVSGKRPEIISFSFANSDLKVLRSSLENIFQTEGSGIGLTEKSQVMKELIKNIRRLAKDNYPVLICGPVGSGKKTSANALHKISSRTGDLIQINLSSFGPIETDKTFDVSGKNIYLQNIENLPLSIRRKIIDILKNGREGIRLFLGTSLDSGTFKQRDPEIYNLMGENILNIPPLSQRKEDIPIIVQQFIEKYSSIHNSKGTSIDEMALRSLVEYNWPSNVLELENLIERLVILHGGVRISHSDLPEKILKNVENSFAYPLPPNGLVLKNVIQDIENSLIGQALSRSRGNKNKAAQLLGLNRTTLVEKLKKKASKS
jgi:DNA-binding NtrC family response regulator